MFYIRARRLWGARKPESKVGSNWRKAMTVVVHHSADSGPIANTPKAERALMRREQDFHMGPERGWSDIGYNYVIMPSGRVYEGRGFGVVGAHAPGWNTKGIGVCFAGTYTDHAPSPEALKAFADLKARLRSRGANIVGQKAHGDVFPTSCPGKGLRLALGL